MTDTPTPMTSSSWLIGIDVGSTTVKCIVVDSIHLKTGWCRYERHETRQAEKVQEMLTAIEQDFCKDTPLSAFKAFITGSGAQPLKESIGARFVQEVNAVAMAVEKLHPDVSSVIELGGQDAKIILFKENPETGHRQIFTSMNDKCASGTGATIDKCVLKVGLDKSLLTQIQFDVGKLHHVAAKCGVFAETDIVNLVKSGIPAPEIMNSLADAIVMQNLSVLTRGNTLKPKILLLGGPNTYLPFLQQCWRQRIPEVWQERGFNFPPDEIPSLIFVPENAQYYAAYGAVVFGVAEKNTPVYQGSLGLQAFIASGRKNKLGENSGPPLTPNSEALDEFIRNYRIPSFKPPSFPPQSLIKAYIGLDGGSTSSKAVLIDENGQILAKHYVLSKGNPIQDTKDILAHLKQAFEMQHCRLEILGFGATGYAADVLEKALRCDANIVETIAHMKSAQAYCGEDIDVICDIGGQDIKVMFLKNGVIQNFRLSNQCSAGNGMLLQAMADQFGVPVQQYAEVAFKANLAPKFSYGCAVFLDTDRVNFQKEGFNKEELFAGLAQVLPKNIWQYVVQIPRLAELGKKFVLQGGTQYNLAAVKAQVDYIQTRVPHAQILVHPHCGEAGAIGAALEARRVVSRNGHSRFIGLQAAIDLHYTARTDESTRCYFCENHCSRTFIDTTTPDGDVSRYIAGFSCEKGTVESKEAVVALNQERKRLKTLYPNLVDYEASLSFRRFYKPETMPALGTAFEDEKIQGGFFRLGSIRRKKTSKAFKPAAAEIQLKRKNLRVGIPRVLNNYSIAPFMRTYLEALGLDSRNIVFSEQTSEELWIDGGKYGSIDPCFPAKVSLAHIHHLLFVKHARQALNYIWFPCITHLNTFVSHSLSSTSCPIVAGTPEVAYAAFTKEKDYFRQANIEYINTALDFDAPEILRRGLWESWGNRLQLTADENAWASEQAYKALRQFDSELQQRGLELLLKAEKDNSLVLLMLGRPYHNDPGLNHDILTEFQTLGYPLLSIRSIPKDPEYLRRFFQNDLDQGLIKDVFDINDVWPESYSTNSVQKVWAAKFAVRHPHVAVIDFSSFKCGHDAPTYGLINRIFSQSKTPYFALHDLDANKPGGSIKIRVKTYAYSLKLYQDYLHDLHQQHNELTRSVTQRRQELLSLYLAQQQNLNKPDNHHPMTAAYAEYLEERPPGERPSGEKYTKEKSKVITVNFHAHAPKNKQQHAKNLLKLRDEMVHQQALQLQEIAQQVATMEELPQTRGNITSKI